MEIELPWTEKYRSKKLDDNIVGQHEIVRRLKAYAKQRSMPNLLFAGPPGVGKTLCAIALAYELFDDSFGQNFMELNASDERGIDVVREQIKNYAATLPFGGVRFKVIFLDEADALTRDAQNALRRTMENTSATTRFILSANYSSKIMEPIQSRCALFRFRPLSEEHITDRLKHIAQKEKIHVETDGYKALVYASEGDMRKAINFLQTASTLGEKVTEDVIYKVAAKARPKEVRELIELAMEGKFEQARKKLDALLYEYGLSGEDVIIQLYREIIGYDIDQKKKIELIDKIGECNFRMTEGANERIQLEALLAYLVLIGKN
jgi:replication factor C small subunit